MGRRCYVGDHHLPWPQRQSSPFFMDFKAYISTHCSPKPFPNFPVPEDPPHLHPGRLPSPPLIQGFRNVPHAVLCLAKDVCIFPLRYAPLISRDCALNGGLMNCIYFINYLFLINIYGSQSTKDLRELTKMNVIEEDKSSSLSSSSEGENHKKWGVSPPSHPTQYRTLDTHIYCCH